VYAETFVICVHSRSLCGHARQALSLRSAIAKGNQTSYVHTSQTTSDLQDVVYRITVLEFGSSVYTFRFRCHVIIGWLTCPYLVDLMSQRPLPSCITSYIRETLTEAEWYPQAVERFEVLTSLAGKQTVLAL